VLTATLTSQLAYLKVQGLGLALICIQKYSLSNDGVHPRGVCLRHLSASQCSCLDNEIINADLDAIPFQLIVKLLSKGQYFVNIDVDAEIIVGDGLFGLHEPLGNDSSDVGHRSIHVGCSSWHGNSCWPTSGRSPREVGRGDRTKHTGTSADRLQYLKIVFVLDSKSK
jgi:hypothetical protein